MAKLHSLYTNMQIIGPYPVYDTERIDNSSVDEVKQLAIKACETNSAEDVRKLIKTKSGDGCYGDN